MNAMLQYVLMAQSSAVSVYSAELLELLDPYVHSRLDPPSIRKVTGGSLVHMSHERINDPGIELGTGPVFYHLYSFLYRPGFPVRSSANDGIEDVRHRHDATRERDRLAPESHRISSSIPPLMVS